jgi:hypothetical protein
VIHAKHFCLLKSNNVSHFPLVPIGLLAHKTAARRLGWVIRHDEKSSPVNILALRQDRKFQGAMNRLSFWRTRSLVRFQHAPPYGALAQQFTDAETWAGQMHAVQALEAYRREVNPKVKLVCCAMAANHASIVDPEDPLQLGCAGLDAHVPSIVSKFIRA